MKFKQIYPLIAVLAFSGVYAQVGINTPNPQVTLDVAGNAASTSSKDGISAPRVTRQQLAAKVAGNYAAGQTGALVYVTDAATPTGTTPSLAQTTAITAVGYYYFSGTAWVAVAGGVNIYNSNGALAGDRVVTQGANTLSFTSNLVNGFSVDGSTLSVDALNNRIGIGTIAPNNRLDLGGLAGSSITDVAGKKLAVYNTSTGSAFYGLGVNSNTLQIHAASAATDAPGAVLTGGGNFGIGTTSPSNTLHVNSATAGAFRLTDGTEGLGKILISNGTGVATWADASAASQNIYNASASLTGNRVVTQNAFTLGFTGTAANAFSVDGSTFSVDAANDRVGVGTTAPVAKLDVVGDYFGIKRSQGSGSWDNLWFDLTNTSAPAINASGAETGLQFKVGTNTTGTYGDGQTLTTVATMRGNGNMGIGTTSPSTTLHVNSTTAGALRLTDGTEGAGKILTSNGTGVATWTDAAAASQNIYNASASLTGNRVVTQNANTLAFTGTVTNAFSVDGSTFSVDAANDRIGLGTAAPQTRLHVVSPTVNSFRYNLIDAPAATGNGVLLALRNTSALANGNMSLLGFTNSGATSGGANWAIGTLRTGTATTNATEEDFYFGSSTGGGLIERMRIKGGTGNVGIGTNAPSTTLHVNSATAGAVRIVDGTQANGRVLTSSALGVATWQDLPSSGSSVNIYNTNDSFTSNRIATLGANTLAFPGTAVNAFSVDGTTFSVDASNNRIGIGTASPQNRLDLGSALGSTLGDVAGKKLAVYNNGAGTSFYGLGISGNTLQLHAGAAATDEPGAVLTNGNNFGVGTSLPAGRMHVAATAEGIINERFAWPIMMFRRSNSATLGTNGGVGPGNGLGAIVFAGNTGAGYESDYLGTSPSIRSSSTQAFTSANMGANMTFFTVASNTNTAAQRMIITHNGDMGIGTSSPTEKLHVIGNILASGSVTPSDIRIKKDIIDNGYGLNEIMKLRTINYKYKDENLSKDKKIGFVAQEVKASMPELVMTANDEMKTLGVNYAEMTVVLTKAVQEQQKEIEELKTLVKELQQQIKK